VKAAEYGGFSRPTPVSGAAGRVAVSGRRSRRYRLDLAGDLSSKAQGSAHGSLGNALV